MIGQQIEKNLFQAEINQSTNEALSRYHGNPDPLQEMEFATMTTSDIFVLLILSNVTVVLVLTLGSFIHLKKDFH